MKLIVKPLTTKTWKDFEYLFGERGACGGCWCMAWRLKSSEFDKQKGAGTKKSMRQLVETGEQIGLISYVGKEPVGWCSFAPRDVFIRLEKSRVLKKIDDQPVWSITCFYISKEFRKMGLSIDILKAVIEFAKNRNKKYLLKNEKKIKILEGYPTVPYSINIPAAFAWTGIPSAFEKAGFKEAARRSKSRPIMRYYL